MKSGFWPGFLAKWFKKWPLLEPAPDLNEGEGNAATVVKADQTKKVAVSAFTSLNI